MDRSVSNRSTSGDNCIVMGYWTTTVTITCTFQQYAIQYCLWMLSFRVYDIFRSRSRGRHQRRGRHQKRGWLQKRGWHQKRATPKERVERKAKIRYFPSYPHHLHHGILFHLTECFFDSDDRIEKDGYFFTISLYCNVSKHIRGAFKYQKCFRKV